MTYLLRQPYDQLKIERVRGVRRLFYKCEFAGRALHWHWRDATVYGRSVNFGQLIIMSPIPLHTTFTRMPINKPQFERSSQTGIKLLSFKVLHYIPAGIHYTNQVKHKTDRSTP